MSSLGQFVEAVHGRLLLGNGLVEGDALPFGESVIDSREVQADRVFWAIKGRNRDGSEFIGEAFSRGAAGVVTTKTIHVPAYHWAVQVDDTQQALWDWAAWKRAQFTGTMIAVSGNIGRTTARQMIDAVLRSRWNGVQSLKSFNHPLGLPLSMIRLEPHHDYAVFELGTVTNEEITKQIQLCHPKVGVITQIGDAPNGEFESRQTLTQAKAELLAALPEQGHAVLGDDPWLRKIADGCPAAITCVGAGEWNHLRAVEISDRPGELTFRLVAGNAIGPYFNAPVWGRHHLTSALSAIAVGRMMGLDLEAMAEILKQYQPASRQCEILNIRGATVLHDAYDATPMSMRAALELLDDFDGPGRRIVVCGDMSDVGEDATTLHWELGKRIVDSARAAVVIASGEYARQVIGGARSAGLPPNRAIPCIGADEALPLIGQVILPGDIVLVKGSHSMAMERVVEALQNYPRRRTA